MPFHSYPYELPPLPYAYNALEPYIDAETVFYHHDRHFKTYVDNLNKALAPYPHLQRVPLTRLLSCPDELPPEARTAILHNGGGVYNHALYFGGLAPAAQNVHRPAGQLRALIERQYGSFERFKQAFNQQAADVFGSGWTALALTPRNTMEIVSLKNQDTTLPDGSLPLLLVDVWEHAYYLKYKNLRANYLNNIWNLLVFPAV